MTIGIKILLLILAIIVVIIVTDVIKTQRLIAVGVAQVVKTNPFEAHPASPGEHFLVLGDSSAVGVGSSTPQGSVAGRLGADFPTADITNIAVSGSKVADAIKQVESLPADQQFDLILIQIGGNDIVRRTPLKNLERDLPTLLTKAHEHSSNIVLLTSGDVGTSKLLPFGTRWFFTWRTKQVREIFMRVCAEENVQYVDLLRPRSKDPYAQDPDTYYSPDYFHPSATGYGDWYSFV